MRKYTLLLALVLFTVSSFCQQPALDHTHYMKKSKRQNTAGWILTSAGTAGLLTTLVADANQSVGGMFVSVFSLGTVEPAYKSYTGYYVASGVVLAAGIYSFSAARHSRQKAKALQTAVKMEQSPVLYSNGIGRTAYPSFSLSVAL